MYPKTYFADTHLVPKPGTCFVVMPFAAKFEPIFLTIKAALETELGLTCTRTKELLGGGNIIEDILRGIGESELVIVDVTGRNPNVFYELGIAHMSKDVEKVILLSQEIESIPFDLRHFRHIVYRPTLAGLRTLSQNLSDAIAAVGQRLHQIVVEKHGRGALSDMLMGTDHCLYQFEVLNGFFGYNAAKFQLRVTRHVMSNVPVAEVVFRDAVGLSLGEHRIIPNTEWSISLERVDRERSVCRIHAAGFQDEMSPRRRPAPNKRNASHGKRRT